MPSVSIRRRAASFPSSWSFCMISMVRIGRTLQSFPPSKRSGRLSTHSAFQLGRTTLVGQISLDDCKVHQQCHCRHLLSLLHLLTLILFSLPWQTFTLSPPLQRGI